MKASSVCVCLIDDCRDADVPLAELTFTSKYMSPKETLVQHSRFVSDSCCCILLCCYFADVTCLQKFDPHIEGRASFRMTGDYFNRSLSGWEPFIEPWGSVDDF